MKITKIKTIRNGGVFRSFDWDRRPDLAGKQFKKVNVIFGRNYSGKTTLSRIVRSLETKSPPRKLDGIEYSIEFDNATCITHSNLSSFGEVVRVYNDEFVSDNLKFLIDENQAIESFAILGERNVEIAREIDVKLTELGNIENGTGLIGQSELAIEQANCAKREYESRQKELDENLSKKANSDIKQNASIYGDVSYNITKIKGDLQTVISSGMTKKTDAEVVALKTFLKEDIKPVIGKFSFPVFRLDSEDVKKLCTKEVQLNSQIARLIESNLLERWVKEGRELHRDKSLCEFCGSPLPIDLLAKIDEHFGKESQELEIVIDSEIRKIRGVTAAIQSINSFDETNFYASASDEIRSLNLRLSEYKQSLERSLSSATSQLEARKASITRPIEFIEIHIPYSDGEEIIKRINEIAELTNAQTSTLATDQKRAKESLRLNEILCFSQAIDYPALIETLESLKQAQIDAQSISQEKQRLQNECQQAIDLLRMQLKDERKGAQRVNEYLSKYFGHRHLALDAIEDPNNPNSFKFVILRDGVKAFNLSEGECSLVSFCYFVARLADVSTDSKLPVIWIDDPIFSLDSNHVYFVYGLIKSEIVNKQNYTQLFLSTHNLDFLKYLKRLCVDKEYGKKCLNFIIERSGATSEIRLMPDYLRKYVTEFNYLFSKILKCAKDELEARRVEEDFYDFGNNARKFLEMYLAFKLPNPEKTTTDKLIAILGEEHAPEAITIERILNEQSHLQGTFERALEPVEIPEQGRAALYILRMLSSSDRDQYESLMESIGENPALLDLG